MQQLTTWSDTSLHILPLKSSMDKLFFSLILCLSLQPTHYHCLSLSLSSIFKASCLRRGSKFFPLFFISFFVDDSSHDLQVRGGERITDVGVVVVVVVVDVVITNKLGPSQFKMKNDSCRLSQAMPCRAVTWLGKHQKLISLKSTSNSLKLRFSSIICTSEFYPFGGGEIFLRLFAIGDSNINTTFGIEIFRRRRWSVDQPKW